MWRLDEGRHQWCLRLVMRSNRSMAHHRRAGTLFGDKGYEDQPPYAQEDQLWLPSLGSHPPVTEPQVVPQELVSPYDRG